MPAINLFAENVRNGSEAGPTGDNGGWTGGGAGTLWGSSLDRAKSGSRCLQWIAPSGSSFQTLESPTVVASPGVEYTASFWRQIDNDAPGNNIKLELKYGAGFSTGVIATSYFESWGFAGPWIRAVVRGTAPAGTDRVWLKLTAISDFDFDDVFIDEVQLEVARPRRNLLTFNQAQGGGYLLDTTGFTSNLSLYASSALGGAVEDTRSIYLPTGGVGGWVETDATTCAAATQYTAAVTLRSEVNDQAGTVQLISNIGVVATTSFSNLDAAEGNRRVTVTGTTQGGATGLRVRVTYSTSGGGFGVYHDDWQLELGGTATAWEGVGARHWADPGHYVWGRGRCETRADSDLTFFSDKYLTPLQHLMPRGAQWPVRDQDTELYQLLRALAHTYARVGKRGDELLIEADPRYTEELVADWETALGLPGDCPQPTTLAGRRDAIVAKLRGNVSPTQGNLLAIAVALGYTVVITTYEDDIFSCVSACNDPLYDDEWMFVWDVTTPSASDDDLLDCAFGAITPDHTLRRMFFT